MIDVTLQDLLHKRIPRYSPDDEQWYQFVSDHKQNLLETAIETPIDPETAFKFRYRPVSLLESLDVNPEIIWVVLFINDINSDQDFIGIKSLYIFEKEEDVSEFYQQYVNWRENLAESHKELTEVSG